MITKGNGRKLVDKLEREGMVAKDELSYLLTGLSQEEGEYLASRARKVALENYGNQVYIRGLIEYTNYCRRDCFYCGIRKGNDRAQRYHLSLDQILGCCKEGYQLGFRTFVLQGGEDMSYAREDMVKIISQMRGQYPDCAITLSIGERSHEDYLAFYQAGANRFLLRHETADPGHYERLHPLGQTLSQRQQCLWDLKAIGYQVGSGMMVGSPGQTVEYLVEDLCFLHELKPQMVGLGPFIPHRDTPFGGFPAGSLWLTLRVLGMVRLILPDALIPATTALGTIHPKGREMGILTGANVVMPNLSPMEDRKKYLLYDNKISTGEESAQGLEKLKASMEAIGYQVVSSRGDWKGMENGNGGKKDGF